ncbi:hypothetical protein FHS29_001682 [Saccharothrix tamanrassetensis]|uniref:Excreted virulence factor EspC (Type VII ESX diderm) n=1 Tax=Saccharothrix tamanrassetensis TaxID=1051531 RepID=A0A841C995_9PSEU|nr:hypothetical protein [Saccharothrix tamanrassetensis]MBB5955112.1 hypothetical protein [Saccharothrix tamanrassetensis]
MTGFETDLAKLGAGAADFTAFAERAGRIFGDLGGALDSFGACWGDDAIGQSFASSHVRPSADALTGLGDLGPALGGVGERFAETARTYREVDDGNSTALGAV